MTTDTRSPAQDDADEIDLRQLLGTLIDHKWWIAGITGAFFVAAAAYALLATPIYRADAIVQVEPKMPTLPGLSDISQSLGMGAGSAEATTEIALITSRAVVGGAVKALALDVEVEPNRFPVLGGFLARKSEQNSPNELSDVRLGMSRYGWGGEKLDVFQLDVPHRLIAEPLTLIVGENGTYELFDDGKLLLTGMVGKVANGGGVTIQIAGIRAHPNMRFMVTRQRHLTVTNELQKEISVRETGKDSGILTLAYESSDPELAERVLHEVAQAYVRQNVERSSAEASAQLSFVKEQLPNIRNQVDVAQKALSDYQTRANSVDLTLQTKGLLDQEVAVETSIQQLRLQQAEMDRKFTRDHPAYQALMRQIGELEGRKSSFQGQVKQLPEAQQELLRLTRDLQVGNEMYTGMLNQAQQLDVARAGTVGNVRVVDVAAVDTTSPVKPRRGLVILIGTAFGVLLSVGLVLLKQILNRGVEDPSQIEELGLPVYASIPVSPQQQSDSVRGKFRADGKLHLLALKDPADLAIEAVRSLRTSLHFARLEAKNNIVLISGASPNAGKTFVSSNLAAVIAQAGQRVLIIDADMRKGTLHKALGVPQVPGLSDLLVGKVDSSAVVRTLPELNNLSFIARGDVPPNPSELLMHSNFTKVLETLAPQYDLIIVDTPPILAVTDAAIIAHHAGTCLMVARFGLNQAKELALAKRRFEQNNVRIKGAIFNAVQRRTAGYYSYGYYEYKSVK
ncbi:polysaccharide biosynthesis tyrosine autokinase [Stenotrophomonas maltophilia]|uniref:polysaccharide biosynthesis tyrosine autokinase n=1 Tax=Stenotrophomonas maltophilia TaxID=40324 RepID=UPI0015DFB248|nr:polysaccharide biosynthesis tyrosine autokinase [Stenotrophomonas maltophilia]ELN2584109.1 polysaccharide biosynthesis tyrosine autokinase [Stenotrophomonas maltophilia]ELN2593343.1 polysaccharide biosynthesis tyrosine autokinase [Stenotrophomonas maltophilia]MBA0296974.1 polysaccharide biosynthesis tyrosine autokinase [Stenotrophomonas maltophilia]MBH1399923.1 polysaccharide biosynthesis tyrosine autokinase [Stenotrophomonas maltophilia]MBH1702293.1 polysaccharide biosynthesis tyrosine aut